MVIWVIEFKIIFQSPCNYVIKWEKYTSKLPRSILQYTRSAQWFHLSFPLQWLSVLLFQDMRFIRSTSSNFVQFIICNKSWYINRLKCGNTKAFVLDACLNTYIQLYLLVLFWWCGTRKCIWTYRGTSKLSWTRHQAGIELNTFLNTHTYVRMYVRACLLNTYIHTIHT